MILKIKNQALELQQEKNSWLNTKKIVSVLLRYKISAIYKGFIIPDDLIAEAESFIERNLIEETNYECCPRCLKAHVIKKAREFGLGERTIKYLDIIFTEEVGHNGHYLDENRVLKI